MSENRLTGWKRDRRNRRSVAVMERVSRTLITAGGLGTIVAVSLIFLFLVWVVLPLFFDPTVEDERALSHSAPEDVADVVHVVTEEELLLAASFDAQGTVRLMRLDTGESLSTSRPFETTPTAASFASSGDDVVLGFEDATVRAGRIGFETDFLEESAAAGELQALPPGGRRAIANGIVVRTPIGQLRSTTLSIALDEPMPTNYDSPVVRIDHSNTPSGLTFAALHEDGALRAYRSREKRNFLTDEVTFTLKSVDLPYHGESTPDWIALAGIGNDLYLAWRDGRLLHFSLREFNAPRLLQELDVTAQEPDANLTSLTFLLGKTTLVTGDSSGNVVAWFPVCEEAGVRLTPVRSMPRGGAAVTTLATSQRSRLFAAGYENNAVRLFHATSGDELLAVESDEPARNLVFAPKEDGLLAWTAARIGIWKIDARHPEATLESLFRPVWYEGAAQPEHVWQSTGGTDDFEPKLGLVPLIFGTLKATFYSLLIGAPLALLAALFSSEFLSPRLRGPIKSTIELMAGLPSVVLGFLAALVIAPFVQSVVPAVLAVFLFIPFGLLLGSHLWQLMPQSLAIRWSNGPRLAVIALTLPIAIAAGRFLGPVLERLLFAGDVKAWLDGRVGSSYGGWLYLMLPLSGLLVGLAFGRWVTPRIRARSGEWSRQKTAGVALGKLVVGSAITLALAAVLATVLGSLGVDSRDSIFGTYGDRNAMIVGFVMGFAIIPIIYTLADDALTEVPVHLREASLGAGASQWQTAVRVVIPTAMSGLFSALMIGLGRAVGETMIVLMAAGNTAIMDLSVFNGFRTLSANIATELPEAVRNSTHYRTLFLAALVLFALTFLLNTVAELVRRHFRKRTHAL